MKLISIKIFNYRSIDAAELSLEVLGDGSCTYGLIGLNEAGKSSILKAIALKDGLIKIEQKDLHKKKMPVEVLFTYQVTSEEVERVKALIAPEPAQDIAIDLDFSQVTFIYSYAPPEFGPAIFLDVSNNSKEKNTRFILTPVSPDLLNRTIFWTAEDKYLISRPIDLATFATNPQGVSVPLRNCFLLARIDDIKSRVDSLENDSTEIEHLQSVLGKSVTDHIRSVWPNHPIEISFLITSGQIYFHVKDTGVTGKAKTAEQRSDGFKQFVSFLLTISAQNRNSELSKSILLLDEPETHLHPLAQEYLLKELIKITENDRENVVLFATHSNYMIDKHDLSRNLRIRKEKDRTVIERLGKKSSTYASVTYEVFDIPSTDHHNELYAKLHQAFQDQDPADDKRERIKHFDDEFFHKLKSRKLTKPFRGSANAATLSTYVRNCIHHPDNGDIFTDDELRLSISQMRESV